ncbi:MAG: CotH kinase family protein [Bacteroidetes bacterium]|nr:CotH kinase family protein [Bacteroidota bacterium]HET6244270.1 CotH kinase family protein [Bacteroidia bacterium]
MKKPFLFFVFFLMFCLSNYLKAQIVINEVSNANGSIIGDETNEFNDWIEIYNNNPFPVSLLNYSLSDDPGKPDKWFFPDISIDANSYKIIFASGKDILDENFLHTNFKLSSNGENIILSDDGNIVDNYYLGMLQNNNSFGRNPDGSDVWCLFNNPSPNLSNNNSQCYEGYEPDPIISLNSGFYSFNQVVELFTPSPTAIIRYTLDGGFPTSTSSLYSSELLINSTKIISAKCYSSVNKLPSKTVKSTYFINENELNLPIFSISINPEDLWDNKIGMYVMGPDASPKFPYYGANFWKSWDKLCHVEYFDNKNIKQFELQAELQIHGGRSRAFAQRSFRIVTKKKLGQGPIEYPLFREKSFIKTFKSINLRNGGQEYDASRIRDAFMHRILKNTNVDIIEYEPVIVFLNGEYWGVYDMRERQDEHYLESNHKVDADLVDVLKHRGTKIWAQAGSNEDFLKMATKIKSADHKSADFIENVSQALDVKNFVDYMASQIYYGNDDWIDNTSPCNNIRLWRSQNSGKWRYAHFDLDKGLGGKRREVGVNNLAMVHNPIGPNVHSDMLRALLKNTVFMNYFVNRYADIMNTTFQPVNMEKIAFEMRDELDPFMHRHFEKWDGTYTKWLYEIDEMLEFNKQRLPIARQHIQNEFALKNQVNVTLICSPLEAGRININTVIPDSLPWTGVYFNGVPVTITAIANPGFTFEYWGSNSIISDLYQESILLNISSDDKFIAYFTGSSKDVKVTFSEINYNSSIESDAGDWLELHNYGNVSVNLTGWYIDNGNRSNLYQIPFGTIIPPNGYAVFSCDTQKFVSQYPFVAKYTSQIPFNLSNSGEKISLLDYNYKMVLSVNYSDASPWPMEADGMGKTLELKDPLVSLDLPSNWFAGCFGGSPGKQYNPECSTGILQNELLNSFQVEIGPNPSFDFIKIKIILTHGDLSDLSFSMYDYMGNEIKRMNSLAEYEIRIDRDNFSPGMYFIKICDKKSFISKKIIFY